MYICIWANYGDYDRQQPDLVCTSCAPQLSTFNRISSVLTTSGATNHSELGDSSETIPRFIFRHSGGVSCTNRWSATTLLHHIPLFGSWGSLLQAVSKKFWFRNFSPQRWYAQGSFSGSISDLWHMGDL